ncbi:hypothetical protein Pan44_16310 [Caulifigura coniformis]|uniref:Uncharacterized protein n=1 Tax=Caulifigura coniformis TaxID=2527983 RepID=A0A517SBV1_9PLAN|nr:hypothetical protein [Caulifigura coniformis]QDT53609.1 hypothetical protein Pan44_16310 [Caulifigura coniformis]
MAAEDELRARIKRLEAIVAALLVSDYDAPPYVFEELFDLGPLFERDGLGRFLRYLAAVRPGYPREAYRSLDERLSNLAASTQQLQADAHAIFAVQSMGIDLDEVRIHRFLPVRVYVDREDPEAVAEVERAVNDTLDAFGLDVADEFPPQQGSWFKKWFARSKEIATSEEMKDVGRKMKRAAELHGMERMQAEINEIQANAIATLTDKAKEFDNAAFQCGTALVVVTTDDAGRKNTVGVTLTAAQAIALENNQQLLYSPGTLLRQLKKICDGDSDEERIVETPRQRRLRKRNSGNEQ